MRVLTHGRAVPAFGLAGLILTAALTNGCRSHDDQTPPGTDAQTSGGVIEGPFADPSLAPASRPSTLPTPRMTSQVVARRPLTPGGVLADLKPAAVLGRDERQLFYPLAAPAQVRVVRRDAGGAAATLAQVEAGQGQILLLERRMGVMLGDARLVSGPLARDASYEVYVLPPGGVVNEATVTRVRPETDDERRQRGEAEKQATEQATTRPSE